MTIRKRKEKKPEKGKPPEKVGRKTTGLTPLSFGGGMVAGSPGEKQYFPEDARRTRLKLDKLF